MSQTSVLRNVSRLISTTGMPLAYSRWLWSSVTKGTPPTVQCAQSQIRGWVSFSDYWWFRDGISLAQRRLIEFCLRRAAGPRPTAVDIGAHLGMFSAELADRGFSEVHAFEPSPVTFEKLKKNMDSNTGTCEVVKLNQLAVGPTVGYVDFQAEPDSPATSHVKLGSGDAPPPGTQRVPMITLDQYCEEQKLSQIDFLKIDTEGLEPFVLDGARQAIERLRVPLIHLELCPPLLQRAGTSVAELYDRIRSLGYEVRALAPAGEPGEVMSLHELERIEWDDVLALPKA